MAATLVKVKAEDFSFVRWIKNSACTGLQVLVTSAPKLTRWEFILKCGATSSFLTRQFPVSKLSDKLFKYFLLYYLGGMMLIIMFLSYFLRINFWSDTSYLERRHVIDVLRDLFTLITMVYFVFVFFTEKSTDQEIIETEKLIICKSGVF